MKKIAQILVSASLVAAIGSVNAEPVSLTDTELDMVSAGAAAADAVAGANAFGQFAVTDTGSGTYTSSFFGFNGYAEAGSRGEAFGAGFFGSSVSTFAASSASSF